MNNNVKFDPMTGQPIVNAQQKFDPMTGQPISNNNNTQSLNNQQTLNNNTTIVADQQSNIVQNTSNEVKLNSVKQDNTTTESQTIANVEQSSEEFLTNIENNKNVKKEEKKSDINYGLVIGLFIIILAAILFVFPIIADYI